VKAGSRALGVAASDGAERSTLCGAVVRRDRVVDGFVYGTATVGGLDATDTLLDCIDRLNRPDVQHLLVAGVAPAWFNLLNLRAIHEGTDRPVVAVSFEDSEGLEAALEREFDGEALARRRARYESLPPRRRVAVNDETVFVRAVGLSDDVAAEVVQAHTPEGGRPEPLRVARLAARAARAWEERGAEAADGDEAGSD
jgi:hypothetical protein